MKFLCLSDTHNQHDKVEMPGAIDVILHAGDATISGTVAETKAFLEWYSKQDAPHKIFIAGNHDGLSEDNPVLFREILKEYPGITYLENELIEICGIKIWGRPTTPRYGNWWHMEPRDSIQMLDTLKIVPANIDILLTHGPAKGILDITERGESVGCEDLLNELERIKPKIVVCGHIHHSVDIVTVNGIKHVNCAILNDNYQLKNQPMIIELP